MQSYTVGFHDSGRVLFGHSVGAAQTQQDTCCVVTQKDKATDKGGDLRDTRNQRQTKDSNKLHYVILCDGSQRRVEVRTCESRK